MMPSTTLKLSPKDIFDLAKKSNICDLCPGVYFICISHFPEMNKQRLVYIGSSKNMRKRTQSPNHPYRKIMSRLSFGYVVFRYNYPCDNYVKTEIECIRYFKPLLNKQYKYGGK